MRIELFSNVKSDREGMTCARQPGRAGNRQPSLASSSSKPRSSSAVSASATARRVRPDQIGAIVLERQNRHRTARQEDRRAAPLCGLDSVTVVEIAIAS